MEIKPIYYIFDVDNGLANRDHRISELCKPDHPNFEARMNAYWAKCDTDVGRDAMFRLMVSLTWLPQCRLILFTSRPRRYLDSMMNDFLVPNIVQLIPDYPMVLNESVICSRDDGNYTDSYYTLKKVWLDRLKTEKKHVDMAFDSGRYAPLYNSQNITHMRIPDMMNWHGEGIDVKA